MTGAQLSTLLEGSLAANAVENIDAVESVEMVFKDGRGYGLKKMTQSAQGLLGLR